MNRRTRVGLAWAGSVALALVVGLGTGRATLAPPESPDAATPASAYTVIDGTVGRTSTFSVNVEWPRRTIGYSLSEGAVTSVEVVSGDTVENGQVLYDVNLRPVVIAQGETPAFRDLAQGVKGPDVSALQRLLIEGGHLAGEPDGDFGPGTTAAVKAWQRSLGIERTGSVLAQDIVFAPDLPTRVVLADGIEVGKRLTIGEVAVEVVLTDPDFSIAVDGNAVPPAAGSPVTVSFDTHSWPARIGATAPSATDQTGTKLRLESDDGGTLCGDECTSLPLVPPSGSVTASVEIVPSASGSVVPVAALGQDSVGGYFVTSLDGDRVPVEVLSTDGSRAVVDGVEAGEQIQTLADGPTP